MEEIEFDDFKKIDLRTGRIVAAERIEGKDKLYKLRVDIGEKEIQLVAGIAPYYRLDELANKQIIVVKNLKPAVIGGVKSEGMLLAAYSDKDNVCCLISLADEIKPGTEVG